MITNSEKKEVWDLLNKARLLLQRSSNNNHLDDSKASKLENRISSIIYAIGKLKTEDDK